MYRLLLGFLYVALVVYALVDVAQSDDEDRHGLPKILWFGAIILLPLVGSIAWIAAAYVARRRKGREAAAPWERAGGDAPAGPAVREAPPTGPEDDAEYMWLLEQARRKKEREERRREAETDDAPDDAPDAEPDAEPDVDESGADERPRNGNRPTDSPD
ncbi:PLD nuclease N-terminal domain-containing protein [Myceligenerans indicum]|uniref:PLDc_N domain-containing protein n=1 Tax=Myceligenerans indicum TaxID=2593663 RepID=A0ABS1LMH3_9MICO|nr:PLD nuclease N-terminal domain-containing protein [Myceligenerans indicum]MBL0887470.1 PLDc_N domain-containing protein [Myceligenerans indicum]